MAGGLAADKFDRGQELIATGACAHYPMLTFAVGTIVENFPDQAEDVGSSPSRGRTPNNGATIWMPAATYIPVTTEGAKLEAAKQFLAYIASVEGTEAMSAAVAPSGPYMIKGSNAPDDVPGAIKDMQPYIDAGLVAPALEFLSPIKGPALEQITVAVGSGLNSPRKAALYDQDVEKQAQHWVSPAGKRLPVDREAANEHRSRPPGPAPVVATEPERARAGATAAIATAPAHRRLRTALVLHPGGHRLRLIFIVPTALSFYYSLTRWTLFDTEFIGLDNFALFLREPSLTNGLRNTIVYAIVTSGLKVVIGLLLARCSPRASASGRWGDHLLSVLVSTVAVGITFAVLMHPPAA